MTDRDALLLAVLDNPEDDFPRLAYADCLEESGNEEDRARADFIRYSIQVPQCSHLALTEKDPFPLLGLVPIGSVPVDGGPQGRELRTWMWAETDALGLVVCDMARELNYRTDRGFISGVMGKLSSFMEHAAVIFASHPVQSVTLTDREPLQNSAWHSWFDGGVGNPLSDAEDLPRKLWDLLEKNPHLTEPTWKDYSSDEDANTDLSRAALLFGQSTRRKP